MSQVEYNASIKSFLLHYQSIYLDDQNITEKHPSILFGFVISDLLLQNKREKLVELRKFNIEAKVICFVDCYSHLYLNLILAESLYFDYLYCTKLFTSYI